METNETIFTGLEVDETSKSYLSEFASWATFLSILGFIGIGLITFFSLISLFFGAASTGLNRAGGSVLMLASLFYLFIAVMYFIPCRLLFLCSNNVKKAIQTNDQILLVEGFRNLKSVFKYYGIFTIIMIGLVIILFIVGGLASVLAS